MPRRFSFVSSAGSRVLRRASAAIACGALLGSLLTDCGGGSQSALLPRSESAASTHASVPNTIAPNVVQYRIVGMPSIGSGGLLWADVDIMDPARTVTRPATTNASRNAPRAQITSDLPKSYRIHTAIVDGKPLLPRALQDRISEDRGAGRFDHAQDGCTTPADLETVPTSHFSLGWTFPILYDQNGQPDPGPITWSTGSTFTVPISGTVAFDPAQTPNDAMTPSYQDFTVAASPKVAVYQISATGTISTGQQEGTTVLNVLVYYPIIDPVNASTTYIKVAPGGSASYDFTDQTPADDGAATWDIWSSLPPDSTGSFINTTTSAPPHANTLTIQTSKTTPTGEYAVGIAVDYPSPLCRQSELNAANILIDVETPAPSPSPSPSPSPTPSATAPSSSAPSSGPSTAPSTGPAPTPTSSCGGVSIRRGSTMSERRNAATAACPTATPAATASPPPKATATPKPTATPTMTACNITSQAQATTPTNRARTTIGVDELVNVSSTSTGVVWSLSGKGAISTKSGASTVLTASDTSGTSAVTATGTNCKPATITFTTIPPSSIVYVQKSGTTSKHTQGKGDIGEELDSYLLPDSVSFAKLGFLEAPATCTCSGYYKSSGNAGFNPTTTATVVGAEVSGKGSQIKGFTRAYSSYTSVSAPFPAGSQSYAITDEYVTPGKTVIKFATTTQTATLSVAKGATAATLLKMVKGTATPETANVGDATTNY